MSPERSDRELTQEGRAAVERMFELLSANDVEKAWPLAEKLVLEHGWSDRGDYVALWRPTTIRAWLRRFVE